MFRSGFRWYDTTNRSLEHVMKSESEMTMESGGEPSVTGRAGGTEGLVSQIIHGSFVDGHGVRTTVFLKGCPLRCVWCCNPEGQKLQPELKFTAANCDGCGRCLDVCPEGAITRAGEADEAPVLIDRALCTNCGECIPVCHADALSCFGVEMTVEEAFNVLKKDERYYSSSGGGITIGGGEPTFQPDFTHALMKKCQADYIHVAIDTCGHTVNELGFRILAEADLLLFDMKGMDATLHKNQTGVSNDVILSNLIKLSEMGKPIIIRVPLIPGCNDSKQNVIGTAEFLSKLKSIQRVDVLPYHKFGMVKYGQLGSEYGLPDTQPQSDEYIDEILNIFEGVGLKTQVGG